VEVLKTVSIVNDRTWPKEKWPELKFKGEIEIGVIGGDGAIR
jgi:hypothetical protein